MDELIGKTLPLKFGSSFQTKNTVQTPSDKYHTVRYDFKPTSVAREVPGEVVVQNDKEVVISLPVNQHPYTNSGTAGDEGETIPTREDVVYKGNKKPAQKECVLIIDHETGEVTLEKLESVMMVKKTRKERTAAQIAALNRQFNQQSQPQANSAAASDEPTSQKMFSDNSNGLPEPMDVGMQDANIVPTSAKSQDNEPKAKKTKKLKTKKEHAEKLKTNQPSLPQNSRSDYMNYTENVPMQTDFKANFGEQNFVKSSNATVSALSSQTSSNYIVSSNSASPSKAPPQGHERERASLVDTCVNKKQKTKTNVSKSSESKGLSRVSTLSSSGSDSNSSDSSSDSNSDSSSDDDSPINKKIDEPPMPSSSMAANQQTYQKGPSIGGGGFDLRDDLQLSDSD